MQYREIVEGKFIDRSNRFIAHVEIGGVREVVHVKKYRAVQGTAPARSIRPSGGIGQSQPKNQI